MTRLQANEIRATGDWLLLKQMLIRRMLNCVQQGYALLQHMPQLPEADVLDRREGYDSHIMCALNGRFGDPSNQFKS